MPNHKAARTLLYVPILHTMDDMGGLGKDVQRAMLRGMTVKALRHKMESISEIWDEIERTIMDLNLDYHKVRLYQDGLPLCGREIEIVEELASKGSRNHKLLLALMNRGATLMGTESAELLTQEYSRVREAVGHHRPSTRPAPGEDPHADGETLLSSRDRYIADRINLTLIPGETGILFIGRLHRVERGLDRDIGVLYPIHRPLNAGGN